MSQEIALVDNSTEQALQDARRMIAKIQVAMVKIYYVFAKQEIREGMKKLPAVVLNALKAGVSTIVEAIKKIVDGMKEIRDKGYVVIALLKEVPNLVEATADLLSADAARDARSTAKLMAFTAVFVEEKYADVQNMLILLGNLLKAVTGDIVEDYRPGLQFDLSEAQLGFDPKTGPDYTELKARDVKAIEAPKEAVPALNK